MNDLLRVAVDGPSGAGKSSVAKRIAAALNLEYIDTGAMYRAVAYKVKSIGLPPEESPALSALLKDTTIDFSEGHIYLDGVNISDRIRTPEMSMMASAVSALPSVREKLVASQREIGENKSVIMDGRDIGSNVLPNAEFKFFLTASVHERAIRRWTELREKGESVTLEDVEKDIENRDYNDTHRALNPLKKADGAVEIDSTDMTAEQVVSHMISLIRGGLPV